MRCLYATWCFSEAFLIAYNCREYLVTYLDILVRPRWYLETLG